MSFHHALRVARFNRPLYLGALIGVIAGVIVIAIASTPTWLRVLAAIGVFVAIWLSCASFFAFHWMFDRSPLLSGSWLPPLLDSPPKRWLQLNAGLEETTLPIGSLFPEAKGETIDIYDPVSMNEPALNRARGERSATSLRSDDNEPCDLIVITLAAHEIRDASKRTALFLSAKARLAPNGRLILVEHLRDFAAFLAFGPGITHFFPRSEWLRLTREAGLNLLAEESVTPFVRVFVCAANP